MLSDNPVEIIGSEAFTVPGRPGPFFLIGDHERAPKSPLNEKGNGREKKKKGKKRGG